MRVEIPAHYPAMCDNAKDPEPLQSDRVRSGHAPVLSSIQKSGKRVYFFVALPQWLRLKGKRYIGNFIL